MGRRDVAEEILQEAFVRSIGRGSTLRDGELATAWFYRLLRNALVDHHRRRDVEQRASPRWPASLCPPRRSPITS